MLLRPYIFYRLPILFYGIIHLISDAKNFILVGLLLLGGSDLQPPHHSARLQSLRRGR